MILSSLQQVKSVIINTIVGTEKAIMFLGKIFVAEKIYNNLNEAIVGCRKDLDMGMGILIAPEESQYRVWVSIPQELILEVI